MIDILEIKSLTLEAENKIAKILNGLRADIDNRSREHMTLSNDVRVFVTIGQSLQVSLTVKVKG